MARKFLCTILTGVGMGFVLASSNPVCAQNSPAVSTKMDTRIIKLQGTVEFKPSNNEHWYEANASQKLFVGDRVRTGTNSQAGILWSDQSEVTLDALTEIEIRDPSSSDALPGLHALRGIGYFFHRDTPGKIQFSAPAGVDAGIEGTEFVFDVGESNGTPVTTLHVIDGKVAIHNSFGSSVVTNHQSVVVEAGRTPILTAGFTANNILQWCFYYPAVLDLDDLELGAAERGQLQESLAAYRKGDLWQALARYPAGRVPNSEAERVYRAALLLSVGQVSETEALLGGIDTGQTSENLRRLADSLQTLIAAVKRQTRQSAFTPRFATEFLAQSYYQQSLATGQESLNRALDCARQSVKLSPQFGFAWVRLGELEFGFGRTAQASEALKKSLELSPRNAQALALKGFILAAQNHTAEALAAFDASLAVDAGLGNAWLGRGLCRIRRGNATGGREDLMVAAAMEPQRSILRSYLGKAYANAGDDRRAGRELLLAKTLDPGDPTAWLYLALLKQQENRINEAVGDLETSQSLNENRGLFRSRLLLDEDKAVRSANLASLYRDAGMTDVSVREASHAVTYDYENYTAHLFLAESYDALRDPTRFNLRYETVWFNELLLANLLSPVGAGRLSQNVTEQEYSRLLDSDGFGASDVTTWGSDRTLTELASQFGTFGRTSYSFDLDYQHNDGIRINNDLDSIEWYTTLKQQITPYDTAFALVKYENYHSGDNFQYYSQTNARPSYRYNEYQNPIIVAGWHHDWAPGVQTLVLAGRLVDDQNFADTNTLQQLQYPGNPPAVDNFGVYYRSQFEIYTAELNQIFQWDRVTVSAGARYQEGHFQTSTVVTNPANLIFPPPFSSYFANPVDNTVDDAGFHRATGYGYLTLQPFTHLWLTGGATIEDMSYPANFRSIPLTSGQTHRSQLGPKAAAVWEPIPEMTLRGVFARSLGGVSLDESYRLEPTQLAGFPQTFRSLIPESLFGSLAAPEIEIYGAALDLKFPSGTFAGIQLEQLDSKVNQNVGLFVFDSTGFYEPATTGQYLDYHESTVSASVNQLLGEGFVAGAGCKFDMVRLLDWTPGIPETGLNQQYSALLQEFSGYLLYNHPSGFFANADATWYHQRNSANSTYLGAGPGDNFVQEDVYLGWRVLNRRVEARFGILDLGGGDYHLSPLNTYQELPRSRTYQARVSFIF